MSQTTLIAAALARLSTAINAVHAITSSLSTAMGDKAGLNTTTKTTLVAAINEVNTALAAIPASITINDAATSVAATWSSSKINAQINAAITAVINGAPGSADTLKELSDQIVALAQADTGLVSTAAAQAFTAPQQLQACTNLGIGDPAHDYVPAITAALNAGL